MPSKRVICHGVEDMAERIQLRVCAAVRDPNWYTIEPQVSVVE